MTGEYDFRMEGVRVPVCPLRRNKEIITLENRCHDTVFTGGDQICICQEGASSLLDGAVKRGGRHTNVQGCLLGTGLCV